MSSKICGKCGKGVYPLEMIVACDKSWHKGCFRCTKCDQVISLKGFATIDGLPFCKPHYLELFKTKGSYKVFSGGDKDASSSFNASQGFKGFNSPASSPVSSPVSTDIKNVDKKNVLKPTTTADKSSPVIEQGVTVKKVDRTGFLNQVEKGSDLKATPVSHDTSSPKIPAAVKTGDRDTLFKEVEEGKTPLKQVDEAKDRSSPVIENVQIKKVDRSSILKEGIVDKPPALRPADDLSNDRSAPVIAPDATVPQNAPRTKLKEQIANASPQSQLKKPDAITDRSSPKIGGSPLVGAASPKLAGSPLVGGAASPSGSPSRVIHRCYKCGKPVYDLEMLKACDKIWHKACFRCKHCDGVLGLKGFATIDGDPYCKPHYLEIFKNKGTYNGFSDTAGNRSSSYNALGGFKGFTASG